MSRHLRKKLYDLATAAVGDVLMKDDIFTVVVFTIILGICSLGIYAAYDFGRQAQRVWHKNQWSQRIDTFISQHFPVK